MADMELEDSDEFGGVDLRPWLLAVIVSQTVLALACVALRLISRRIRKMELWWDDWTIIITMCWNLVVVALILVVLKEGLGIHMSMLPLRTIVIMYKLLLVTEILYGWNLCLTKISLLLMYYRIFRFGYFQWMPYTIGVFVIVWGISITFIFVYTCVPVENLWSPYPPRHCIDESATWVLNLVSTIFTDIAILLLPLPQVWKLQLRLVEKVAVTGAFGLGFFVVFASAYRFSVLYTYQETDPSFSLTPTVGWTVIEMATGIISACLPTLGPVIGVVIQALGFNNSPFCKHRVDTSSNTNSDIYTRPQNSKKKDERDADVGVQELLDLRPDGPFDHTGPVIRSDTESMCGDEVPLNGIRVKTEISHTTLHE